ncbi:MAG: sugar ABC transporter permease [Candidatus Caenarcaniphilales bacterium]|jgi:multiple sugar transport system permease protein|nr:sugar ABC transporter permease [Candidatus Caenarcaniphilales bacterium]
MALIFLIPWLIGLVCFLLGPILASLFLSFTDYDGINNPSFVGLANYSEMLADPIWLKSLGVTFVFAFTALPLGTVIAIVLAVLLNNKVLGQSFFRVALYLPSIVPIVASSVTWSWIFRADDSGLLNQVLNKIFSWIPGYSSPMWLADPNWALSALIIMSFWSLGNPMLIYLAGLQNIPESLYESARLDGASSMTQFWHITLPCLAPTIFFNVVIGIIQVFQYFVPAYVMTSGGPQNATMFYSLYAYQTAFDDFRMGYASALAWVLFVIVLIATALAFVLNKKQAM